MGYSLNVEVVYTEGCLTPGVTLRWYCLGRVYNSYDNGKTQTAYCYCYLAAPSSSFHLVARKPGTVSYVCNAQRRRVEFCAGDQTVAVLRQRRKVANVHFW